MLTSTDIQRLTRAFKEIFYSKEELDQKFEQELSPIKEDIKVIRTDIQQIKDITARIDRRDLEDSNAMAKSYVKVDTRLTTLEKYVKGVKRH